MKRNDLQFHLDDRRIPPIADLNGHALNPPYLEQLAGWIMTT